MGTAAEHTRDTSGIVYGDAADHNGQGLALSGLALVPRDTEMAETACDPIHASRNGEMGGTGFEGQREIDGSSNIGTG